LGKNFRAINAARASNAHNHQRLDARRGKAARIYLARESCARPFWNCVAVISSVFSCFFCKTKNTPHAAAPRGRATKNPARHPARAFRRNFGE
jgi:hypothetical protein